jgi:hypothetical protein
MPGACGPLVDGTICALVCIAHAIVLLTGGWLDQQEEAPIRRLSQTYAQPQLYINDGYGGSGSNHAASTSQHMHRVTPSKSQQPQRERSRSRSRPREENGHAAMNGNGHHRSHERYPRTDVEIPHSKPPALSEEARQRNQLSRSKAARKRLQEEAELVSRGFRRCLQRMSMF